MQILIVLPTYNERDNIGLMIDALKARSETPHILVVDDKSPDGTADIIRPLCDNRVHLLVRDSGKGGRGGAVRCGFDWGLKQGMFDLFFEMDSDRSHRVEEISLALSLMKPYESDTVPTMVIGSRYLKGSRILGWPFHRHFFSRFANIWAKFLLKQKVSDFTNGFRAYNKAAVNLLLSYPQQNTGFIYLSETLSLIGSKGGRILEFPTTWENRRVGVSNANFPEFYQAFWGILKISRKLRAVEKRIS